MDSKDGIVPVIVVTRFNVAFTDAQFMRDKAGGSTRTEQWLEDRFALFTQVCLPSLMAQTDQGFTWYIFFSIHTPQRFKDRLEELRGTFTAIRPIFLKDGENLVHRFQREVTERVRGVHDHVITIRIDNDDAFHRTMVERVRSEFTGQEDEYLNFLDGVQCDLEHGIAVHLRKANNPFMARIERVGDGPVRTVYEVPHQEAHSVEGLRNLEGGPMWMQLIHGGNVTNQFSSSRLMLRCDLRSLFGIPVSFRVRWWPSLSMAVRRSVMEARIRYVGALKSAMGGT